MAVPTTKEGWREFCAYQSTPLSERPSLTRDEIYMLSTVDRDRYNDRRRDYINEERVFPTRDVELILTNALRLWRRGRCKSYIARPGLRVSGESRVGKSTGVMAAGKHLEGVIRRADSREGDMGFLPILYINIATVTTPNKLWSRFAEFAGARELRGRNADERLLDLARLLRDLGTKFVILDEAQCLDTDRSAGAEVADNIKSFAESIDATMIFAGVELEMCPLFSGAQGLQWRRRTRPINLSNYRIANESDYHEWIRLVAAFEQILPLTRHEKGFLERNADYLFHRTGGSIAYLHDLICDAAIEAIDTGEEAVTLAILDSCALYDHPTVDS